MKKLGFIAVLFLIVLPSWAYASCTDPVGEGGDIIYNSDYQVVQYCNETNWISFPQGATGCALPWGGVLASGASVTAYAASDVPFGNTCSQETRNCAGNTLSGSYEYETCTVGTAADCNVNGYAVVNGASHTFYSATVSADCASVGQSRTCTNGTMSGSGTYQYSSCLPPYGQTVITASGTFTVPATITSISAVCVGAGTNGSSTQYGAGSRGGDLRYAISLAVTAGENLTVTIGASGSGGLSKIARGGTDLLVARGGTSGTSTTTGANIGGGSGGAGGAGAGSYAGGGGGAGGYSGDGGAGGTNNGNGAAGAGGGGGGGDSGGIGGRGGGGVGLLGAGTNGAASGGGGSSGGPGGGATSGNGGTYGGGGGAKGMSTGTLLGGAGACRIIWGTGRAYPSTYTADNAMPPACGGSSVGGSCWYLGAASASCDTTCATHGGYNAATMSYAGSGGTNANCTSVLTALTGLSDNAASGSGGGGRGCYLKTGNNFVRDTDATLASATTQGQRACACNN